MLSQQGKQRKMTSKQIAFVFFLIMLIAFILSLVLGIRYLFKEWRKQHDALEHYGNGPQVDMAIEEMSELTKELLKDRRGKENRSDIAMEMADVYIMLEQLKFIFGIDETELKVNAELKIQRLKNRIGGNDGD